MWLCFWVIERSRGRVVVWCGFCGCHFAVFGFDFLHDGRYRLPPPVTQEYGMHPTLVVRKTSKTASVARPSHRSLTEEVRGRSNSHAFPTALHLFQSAEHRVKRWCRDWGSPLAHTSTRSCPSSLSVGGGILSPHAQIGAGNSGQQGSFSLGEAAVGGGPFLRGVCTFARP